ncbi:hypothetical protein ID0084_14650 [Helicobacter pylori]
MIDGRDENKGDLETFDYMDRVGLTLFCNVIHKYALRQGEYSDEIGDLSLSGVWATILPRNKNKAYFIAQFILLF